MYDWWIDRSFDWWCVFRASCWLTGGPTQRPEPWSAVTGSNPHIPSSVIQFQITLNACIFPFYRALWRNWKKMEFTNFVVSFSGKIESVWPTRVMLFVDIETSCSGDSLLIMASLSEPFYGLLYAKGYATTPSCRVDGGGNRLLKLALDASECGIRFIEMPVSRTSFTQRT